MPDPAAIRVLIVEDDPAMVALIRKLLQVGGYQRIQVTASTAEALAHAAESDIIILDYQLPDGTGIDLLPRLLSRSDPPSVIMVTGEGNETLAATALRAGAEDYLVKDHNLRDLLPQIVERARRNRALREAQTAVEQELVRAERIAAIGEMTVTLHHEINNPLMSASAEVELLLTDRTLAADRRESLESVRDSLLRIRDIIKRAGELRQASSADYLAGLRMINLAAADPASRPSRGRALLWIADESTARLAALLLRHAGFTVERVESARELGSGAGRLGVTLVVLSAPGTPDPTVALGGFAADPARGYALVALIDGDPAGARAAGVDRVLQVPFDPATLSDELIAAVDERLGA
ncbi:MAG: response regulator [Gemmatimonadetes bacterium]|nr:response regulator [Gemmatimonadota bacterium]MCC7134272.1 response regulator [Gemmatimonadales bacterium]